MNRSVNVLVTLDIHCYPAIEKDLPMLIEEALKTFGDLSIRTTFLFPAIYAEKFSEHVKLISSQGHEIGCHGLTHDPNTEKYNSLSYDKQKAILHEAKERIEAVAHTEVVSFRSPAFKINADTVRALEENGFKADLSVNPQRLGLLSADFLNIGWLYSPRVPYHPDLKDPFKRGDSSVWEIPQSSFILPFMSNTGMAFGEAFMRSFFKLLYYEAQYRHNPIVYMLHIEDIYPIAVKHKYKFQWSHLWPSKTYGFQFRYALLHNKNGSEIAKQNKGLLKMMSSYKPATFITAKEMLEILNTPQKSDLFKP